VTASPSPRPFVRVVCAVLRSEDGRIFSCRRPLGKSLGGLWEFPGGKIEPGEAAEAALVRELSEELGVQSEILSALTPVCHAYPTFDIELLPFIARVVSGEIHLHEHSAAGWYLPDEMTGLDWAPADLPILRELGMKV
jgi:8-oxo-dGTP diphosphatase